MVRWWEVGDWGRSGFVWWRGISKIRDGDGAVGGGWFQESIGRRVGNGEDTFFSDGSVAGGVLLSVKYRCLFDLSNNKSASVAVMCELGWEEEGAAWQWRHNWNA
jgi:hypothetical protein